MNVRVTRRRTIIAALVVVATILIIYFPRPLVSDPGNSSISMVLYRADEWDDLRWFYPSPETGRTIDEEALLQYLHQKKCVRRLFSFTTDAVPAGEVTLVISVGDGEKSKQILLGEWNEERVQNGRATYSVLGASSVLKDVLDILGIDETTDLSGLRPIAN